MRRELIGLAIFTVSMLVGPASAFAARGCQYDIQCSQGQVCADGVCRDSRQRVAKKYESAEDACGNDRRCRIDRLARRNRARRHVKVLDEERWVRKLIDEERDERLKDFPRKKDPVGADLRISRLGPVGVTAGYVFGGHFRPEASFVFNSANIYQHDYDGSGSTLDGTQETFWFDLAATYFVLQSWFTPYLTAGFMIGKGTYNDHGYYYYAPEGGGMPPSGPAGPVATVYHAAEIGGGLDLQFAFGLHARVGLNYRPLIYSQASVSKGVYDDATRKGLTNWFKSTVAIDPVVLMGWAFSF